MSRSRVMPRSEISCDSACQAALPNFAFNALRSTRRFVIQAEARFGFENASHGGVQALLA